MQYHPYPTDCALVQYVFVFRTETFGVGREAWQIPPQIHDSRVKRLSGRLSWALSELEKSSASVVVKFDRRSLPFVAPAFVEQIRISFAESQSCSIPVLMVILLGMRFSDPDLGLQEGTWTGRSDVGYSPLEASGRRLQIEDVTSACFLPLLMERTCK